MVHSDLQCAVTAGVSGTPGTRLGHWLEARLLHSNLSVPHQYQYEGCTPCPQQREPLELEYYHRTLTLSYLCPAPNCTVHLAKAPFRNVCQGA